MYNKTISRKETIHYFTDYFQNYSIPRIIISVCNRDTSFILEKLQDFISENNVKHILITIGSS